MYTLHHVKYSLLPSWHFAHGTVVLPPGVFKASKEIRLVGARHRATVIYGKHSGSAVLTLIAVDAERWVVMGTWEPAKR